eukprot:4772652-Prymnesium_polylepis.1
MAETRHESSPVASSHSTAPPISAARSRTTASLAAPSETEPPREICSTTRHGCAQGGRAVRVALSCLREGRQSGWRMHACGRASQRGGFVRQFRAAVSCGGFVWRLRSAVALGGFVPAPL